MTFTTGKGGKGSHLNTIIMSLLSDRQTIKLHKILQDTNLLAEIDTYLSSISDASYILVNKILDVSEGLEKKDKMVKLKEDWGVKLNSTSHSLFIDSPNNIRTTFDGKKILISNKSSTVPNAVVDQNLNLIGLVGKLGSNVGAGQYIESSDFIYHEKLAKYMVASAQSHVVQIYDEDGGFNSSIGTGIAGADGTKLTSPVAVGASKTGTYVLCSGGTVAGANGQGFLAFYDLAFSSPSILLYPGIKNGNGRVFEGEIKEPKDMVVVQEGNRDRLYILNSTDEIGIFHGGTGDLEGIINIPSSYLNSSSSLGLSKMAIKDQVLYVTASNVGQILAIDLKTKTLIGSFGEVKSESTLDSPQSLGVFNGLSGVCLPSSDKIVCTETLNSRVQVFGKNLLSTELFSVTTELIKIPLDKDLVSITVDADSDKFPSDVLIIDATDKMEYSIESAIKKKITSFSIKILIKPSVFSNKNPFYSVCPIYVNVES